LNPLMIEEALSAPGWVQKHVTHSEAVWTNSVKEIRQRRLLQLVTIARGSSDHAAQFLAYVMARKTGLMPASLAPSLLTLYEANLFWEHSLAVAISQSGASPDLCHSLECARRGGAMTLALVNHLDSPLARVAQLVLPMGAGEEKSVAATKSFLLSLVNAWMMAAAWNDDGKIWNSLERLPEYMEKSVRISTQYSLGALQNASSILVLSRGQGLSIAQEIALKFNEVCRLPALAYSAAEFRHGPMALLRKGDPVLVIGMRGPELPGLLDTVRFLREIGATVIFVAPMQTSSADLEYPVDAEDIGDPLIAVQLLYPLIARLAMDRGHDPDQPAHLQKVTRTL